MLKSLIHELRHPTSKKIFEKGSARGRKQIDLNISVYLEQKQKRQSLKKERKLTRPSSE